MSLLTIKYCCLQEDVSVSVGNGQPGTALGLEALRTWLALRCGGASLTAAPASAQGQPCQLRACVPASLSSLYLWLP